MRTALREAAKGLGLTSPNPAVGAVLVVAGKVVSRGHHRGAGLPHAEVECLGNFRGSLKRAILYVTLEPCSTRGRTPPCTEALIAAGVRAVVIGAIDPNPEHAGRAMEILRAAGIEVQAGILADECRALNQAFNKWITTRRPFVIAKCGMTLDGRLTRPAKEPRWITSVASRKQANNRRALVDAILVGAETVRRDNPRLTVRDVRGARAPWRVILTRSGKLPRDAHVFTDAERERTLVFKKQPLASVLEDLGQREITSVLLEGGGEILSQALDARLIDRVEIYLGGMITGGPVVAFAGEGAALAHLGLRLKNVRYEKIGNDILVSGDATYSDDLPNN